MPLVNRPGSTKKERGNERGLRARISQPIRNETPKNQRKVLVGRRKEKKKKK